MTIANTCKEYIMRKLVTKRVVDKLIPIEGADRIELAMIDGWSCIVKKGEFSVGDAGVYFEIDSFLPSTDTRFSFLGDNKVKEFGARKGWRIRTMKMRGVISQGLLLPVAMFSDIDIDVDDMAEQLLVVKWERSEATERNGVKTGNSAGKFPSFLPKTDQPRLQNAMHYFNAYSHHTFEETKKLDGSSCTMYKILKPKTLWQRFLEFFSIDDRTEHFGVCSRNLEIKSTDTYETTFQNSGVTSTYAQSDFWYVARKYTIINNLPAGFAVQGELIGPKIQSNHEKVVDKEFYVFDVYDIGQQEYLLPADRALFMAEYLPGVKHVPIVKAQVDIFALHPDLDSLQRHVTGESMNKGVVSEGRVYKSTTVPGLSFKLISNEFLLRYDD